ncbi:hypothetical protein L596_021516 [Steinernema carpocapsae]|uniref:Uncharacterized protein n=1 Tax=Steinernema carpocapsae TaxID=34508 RepID=A0A4U5MJB8_STECR|nr:hypothetical protein L596_021516 [Steinernema carpocapsae]
MDVVPYEFCLASCTAAYHAVKEISNLDCIGNLWTTAVLFCQTHIKQIKVQIQFSENATEYTYAIFEVHNDDTRVRRIRYDHFLKMDPKYLQITQVQLTDELCPHVIQRNKVFDDLLPFLCKAAVATTELVVNYGTKATSDLPIDDLQALTSNCKIPNFVLYKNNNLMEAYLKSLFESDQNISLTLKTGTKNWSQNGFNYVRDQFLAFKIKKWDFLELNQNTFGCHFYVDLRFAVQFVELSKKMKAAEKLEICGWKNFDLNDLVRYLNGWTVDGPKGPTFKSYVSKKNGCELVISWRPYSKNVFTFTLNK